MAAQNKLVLILLLNCSLALASKNYHPKLTATRPNNDPRFKSQRDIDDDEGMIKL